MGWMDSARNWIKNWLQEYSGKLPSWPAVLKGMVFHTGGNGPSITKGIYAFVCLVTGVVLIMLVRAFCKEYMIDHTADSIFAGVITALGLAFIGFPTSAHKRNSVEQIKATGALNANPADKPDNQG